MEIEFLKYEESGAYHWRQTSSSLKHHNAGLSARYKKALELAEGLSPKKILDIGCGDGRLSAFFAERFRGAAITGVDTSKTAIELARKKTSDLKNINFVDGSFFEGALKAYYDLIVCADVIEHIEDQRAFVEKCRELLSDKGFLVLTTPVRVHEFPEDRFHAHEFFPEELKDFLTQSKFEILKYHLSHPVSVAERYNRIYSPLGAGRMRLNKYVVNFFSIVLGRNPFIRFKPGRYSVFGMQSLLARKKG